MMDFICPQADFIVRKDDFIGAAHEMRCPSGLPFIWGYDI
jgi:hypothetical protein